MMNTRRYILGRCAMGLPLALVSPATAVTADEPRRMPIPDALKRAIQLRRDAVNEFVKGNVALWKEQCSHRDDVTIIGGWGGFEKGWAAQVEKRYEWAAARFKGSEGPIEFENISLVVTPELAYSVDIERGRVRVGESQELAPMVLRVTTIFRLEGAEWKMVHRHADPLMNVQAAGSVIQK